LIVVAAIVASCASASSPSTGNGGRGTGGGITGGGATVANACNLLSAADVQAAVGHAVTMTTPFQNSPGQPGCTWEWPSDTGTDNVSLTVVSPGGKADYDSTRTFDEKFLGGFASLGAAAASLAAPIDSGLGQAAGNIFQMGDLSGIGDEAFMGPGVPVYAVKGDSEIQLQILDVSDSDIPGRTVQLAKLIISRL
jgi:hypothetical protein